MKRFDWKSAKVLVTGGAGFIGRHLTTHLRLLGADVTSLDLCCPADDGVIAGDRLPGTIRWVRGRVEANDARTLIARGDFHCVFHLAGGANVPDSVARPAVDFRKNLMVTVRLLENLRRCPTPPLIVYASSAAVYGEPKRLPIQEQAPTLPISPYGVAKLSCEKYLSVYSHLYGIRCASARLFSVFGPGLRKQVVYDLMCRIREGSVVLELRDGGRQQRDFIYAIDAAAALTLIAQRASLTGEAYNVASGEARTIRDLAVRLCRLMSPEVKISRSESGGGAGKGEPVRWRADVSRLGALGFKPGYTFDRGLRETVDWFAGLRQ